MNWLNDIWSLISTIVNAIGQNLDNLATRIDSVSFDSSSTLYQFLGMAKYVTGDTAWTALVSMFQLGLMLSLYRLTLIVIQVIGNLIPGLKGRIAIR